VRWLIIRRFRRTALPGRVDGGLVALINNFRETALILNCYIGSLQQRQRDTLKLTTLRLAGGDSPHVGLWEDGNKNRVTGNRKPVFVVGRGSGKYLDIHRRKKRETS
jgi:hypothetical protein